MAVAHDKQLEVVPARTAAPMPSSELSNALNPYIVQTRSRSSGSSYSTHLQPVVQPSQQHVPHRSELELAITEPPPPRFEPLILVLDI